MMRILTIAAGIFWATALASDPVAFTGAIGPYEIEMELEHDSMHNIQGRYRYAGREVWLNLSGRPFGTQVLKLSEFDEGRESGIFLLQVEGGGLSGYWTGAGQDYPVKLTTSGAVSEVFPVPASDSLSPSITGQYAVYFYWVNDWFAPNYEVGFNGGSVNVVEISDAEVLVQFQFTVGPTYHMAYFMGVAQKTDDRVYVHDAVLGGGTDSCRLEFRFDDTGLVIRDEGNGFACGFGARAHANFGLPKVGDIAEFGGHY